MHSVHSIAATTEETTATEAKSRIFQTVAEVETKSAMANDKVAVIDTDTFTLTHQLLVVEHLLLHNSKFDFILQISKECR